MTFKQTRKRKTDYIWRRTEGCKELEMSGYHKMKIEIFFFQEVINLKSNVIGTSTCRHRCSLGSEPEKGCGGRL